MMKKCPWDNKYDQTELEFSISLTKPNMCVGEKSIYRLSYKMICVI